MIRFCFGALLGLEQTRELSHDTAWPTLPEALQIVGVYALGVSEHLRYADRHAHLDKSGTVD